MATGIYAIKNKQNSKVYIGRSVNLERRRYQHFEPLKRKIHYNTHLQLSWNKYGEENFEFVTLEECNEDVVIKREAYWISYFNACNPDFGYNSMIEDGKGSCRLSERGKRRLRISAKLKFAKYPYLRKACSNTGKRNYKNGVGGLFQTHNTEAGRTKWYTIISSQEHRQKCSEAAIKRGTGTHIRTEKMREDLSTRLSGEGNPRYGVVLDEELKSRISVSVNATFDSEPERWKKSDETKQKMSEARTKLWASKSVEERKLSDKHRERISEAGKGRVASEKTKLKRAKTFNETIAKRKLKKEQELCPFESK